MSHDTLLLSDRMFLDHDPGEGHPDSPDRLRFITAELARAPIAGVRTAAPPPATISDLERVHSRNYIDHVLSLRGRSAVLDADTTLSPGSVEAALLAAGGAMAAVSAVVQGDAKRAFALGRPPGHHAEPSDAMGFCVFNNVAVAAAHARANLGCERVLVIDWDVHHGNGTQHMFYGSDDVLVFNTHRFPFYPGTGAASETGSGAGAGFTVNVPLPPAMIDGDYAAVYRDVLWPVAEAFKPDLVLVSAGFDPHAQDPLGGMRVTEDGFAHLAGVVADIADRFAGGRLALTLEGGYHLGALARSVRAVVQVLAGATPPPAPAASSRLRAPLREVAAELHPFFPTIR